MQQFVNGIRYIPSPPGIIIRILTFMDNDQYAVPELEKIISSDQALSSKILSMANSAYYGFRNQILTVDRAISALGHDEVHKLCLGVSLMGFLRPKTLKDTTTCELLWLHSLTVAHAAQLTAKLTSPVLNQTVAYTGGLLHDLGKALLSTFYPEELENISTLIVQEGLPYREAEKALGIEHARLGQYLAEHWDLPLALNEIIGHHHDLQSYPENHRMCCAVHLGDYLTRDLGLGSSGNTDPPEYSPEALLALKLDEDSLAVLKEQLAEERLHIIGQWQAMIKSN